jgi:hypothetical protein
MGHSMKKFLLLLLLPACALAQTASTYYTVPTIAALKALTTRPGVVEVRDSNPGIFNWSTSACGAADDIFQVTPTSGPSGCYSRMAGTYAVGKNGSTSVFLRGDNTWATPAGAGTVTSASVATANGFAGTVANATSTPAISITTSITAPVLKGDGTAIAGATTTGSGSTVVLNNGPTLIAPVLGTPASGNASNMTSIPVNQATGNLPVANLGSGTAASASTFWRGDNTWATPSGGGNISNTGTPTNGQLGVWTASTVLSGVTLAGDCTLSSPNITCTKTSGSSFATSATTDTTNASNISSGTLGAARLPSPSSSTLGGVESIAAVSHKWINTISTSGVPSLTQPDISDLSSIGTGVATQLASAADGSSASGIGFRGVPQNLQSTNYTLVMADAGKHIYGTTGTNTWTIPANSGVAFPIGTAVTFINLSGTAATIAITTDTLYLGGTGTTGSRTLAQFGVATAVKIDSTHWIISGPGLT